MSDNNLWCPKCGRAIMQHVPGEEAVYIEHGGEVLVVACDEAQPYLTPHGTGKLLNPNEVDDSDRRSAT